MRDLLEGKVLEIRPNDQPESFVRLVDTMPRLVVTEIDTGDFAVVQAARVSFQSGTEKKSDDRTLLRYLLRHSHSTPFEMIEMKWHMSMPIFIARQFIRHRTANVNEESGRYSVMKEKFYIATLAKVRKQSNTNKQGGTDPMEAITAQELIDLETEHDRRSYELYQRRIAAGMARELARNVLPLNLYTSWYWKCDMWNTMNFMRLRKDSHAQIEIQEMAIAMYDILKPIFPDCIEAFDDYVDMEKTCKLSRLEVQRIKERALGVMWLNESGKDKGKPTREELEFQAKLENLGLCGDD